MTNTTRFLGIPGDAGPGNDGGDDERRVLAWLDELLDLPEDQREAAMARFAPTPAQERRLRQLLGQRTQAGAFLEVPPASLSRSVLPQDGERIGIYRIERPLSAGGMGVVYLAERDDGVYRQRVAIKLVQPSQLLLDPARRQGLLTRFEEERAILAQLQHPNIVHILDGGQTEQGLPYLVMDFVDGVDLMQFCQQRQLDVSARLGLFCQVCDAVQEAHRHLIVHRDLKPGNVLVDANGVPHLLDFGIAKLLDPLRAAEVEDATQATVLGAMTPAYASPEQLRRRPLTTRSDIYSLGVILYQMLAGKRPYDTDDLSPAELERAVCDTEPPTLSRALRAADAEPGYAQVPKRLPSDLERIVAKALHKEPERRYGTAQELADDLRRYAAGEPVLAQRDTLAYRTAKFLGRHRVASALVGTALVLILAASVLALHQAHQARQAAIEAGEINAFLLEVLNQSNIDHVGAEVQLGDVLEAAAVKLDERFGDRPAIAASIRNAIGGSLIALNRIGAAEGQLETGLKEALDALGQTDPLTLKLAETLALLRVEQGRYSEGVGMLETVLTHMVRAGKDDTLDYVRVRNNLGYIHIEQGDYAAARPHIADVLAAIEQRGVRMPEDEHAAVLSNYAQVLDELGESNAADAMYRRAEVALRKLYPEGSRDLAILLNNRAILAFGLGRGGEALDLLHESVEMRRRSYRGDHPVVVFGLTNLARTAAAQGRFDLAGTSAQEAIEMAARLSDGGSEEKARAHAALAEVFLARKDVVGARAALGDAERALSDMPEAPERTRSLLDQLNAQVQKTMTDTSD